MYGISHTTKDTDSQVHIKFHFQFSSTCQVCIISKDQVSERTVITSLHHLFSFNLMVLVTAHHHIRTRLKVLLTYIRHHRVTNFQGCNISRIQYFKDTIFGYNISRIQYFKDTIFQGFCGFFRTLKS